MRCSRKSIQREDMLAKEHMTFLDLATYFEKQYLKPAEYVDGRKVAGFRVGYRLRSTNW